MRRGKKTGIGALGHALVIVLALALGLVVGWLSLKAVPAMTVYSVPADGVSVLDEIPLQLADYEVGEDGLCRLTHDVDAPMMYLDLSAREEGVQALALYVTDYDGVTDAEVRPRVRLLALDGRTDYAESDYALGFPREEDGEVVFQLPEGFRGTVGVSIHGSFRLSDIVVSPNAPEKAVQAPDVGPLYVFFPCVLLLLLFEGLYALRRAIKRAGQYVLRHIGRVILCCALEAAGAAAGWALGWLLFKLVFHQNYHFYRMVYFVSLGAVATALAILWESLVRKTERAFAALALIMGVMSIIIMPVSSFVTWDDMIHYQKALALSYGGTSAVTAADDEIISLRSFASYGDYQAVRSHEACLNEAHEQGARYCDQNQVKIEHLAYLPFSMGLWLGRLLRLPFTATFRLGKIMTLLVYVFVVYAAIRRLKHGKILLAAVALLPTAVFQACNYTYDGWVNAFILLGTALYMAELQDMDEPMTIGREIGIIAAFLIGSLAKAVYFPIIWMMFAMPRGKFESRGRRRLYYAVLLAGIAASVALLGLTLLQDTSVITDARGGDTVNGMEQIKYIFTSPVSYAVYLLKFLFVHYLNPHNFDAVATYVGNFIQMGFSFSGCHHLIIMMLFVALTGFSHSRDDRLAPRDDTIAHLTTGFAVFATICVLATTMYVAFNPVGSHDPIIAGCQGRYILPLLFAALSTLHTRRITSSLPGRPYNLAVFAMLVFVYYYGMWNDIGNMI